MTVKCVVCNSDFQARRYDYENRRTITCSKECRKKLQEQNGINKQSGETIKCSLPSCDKQIYRPKHKINKKTGYLFCCKEHQVKARFELDDFKSGRQTIKRRSYRRFGLLRHGAICVGCRYKEIEDLLDVHHIDQNRKNGEPENLIVLCVMCHAKVTRGYAKIDDRKFINLGP